MTLATGTTGTGTAPVVLYEALKYQCHLFGFEITEGQFTLPDGKVAPLHLVPTDPEALVYAAARVYSDRAYVRRQKVLSRRGADVK